MSFAGLKKQFHKAGQLVTEKMGKAEGTKLDEDFMENSKKVELFSKLVEELLARVFDYLPHLRSKQFTLNTLMGYSASKGEGTQHPESLLGECMQGYGAKMGLDSIYGQCLIHSGESFKYLADIKSSMEEHVRESFIKPLQSAQTTEVKDVSTHRKKMESRRLDYDYKKRKQDPATSSSGLPDEELRAAEAKFLESKENCERAMVNVLNLEVEHLRGLLEFVSAQTDYFRQGLETMENLQKYLIDKKDEAVAQPRVVYQPKDPSYAQNHFADNPTSPYYETRNVPAAPSPKVIGKDESRGPCCRGLYEFEPENDSELAFNEGDIIRLIRQLDDNWFEGEVNGRTGYFPVNYVEVMVPLP